MQYKKHSLPEYPCKEDMWDILKAQTSPIVVYGMGNGADKLINRFAKYGIEIADFFASDGFVRGHSFHGKRVKAFSEIKAEYSDFVIVLSFASNKPEVVKMLGEISENYNMYIPDMPISDEEEYFDREFYNSHYSDIVKAYNSLYDSESKSLFCAMINYKLTGRGEYLFSSYTELSDMYDMLPRKKIKSIVDVGAYNGDTLKQAVAFFPDLTSAIAIEPDVRSFAKLQKYADTLENIKVQAVNGAAWSHGGKMEFSSSGNRNSTGTATVSFKHKSIEIDIFSVDSLVSGRVDYIKYDVEGAEREALLGSDITIQRYSPSLLVSLYHKSRDIFELINIINERYPDYTLRLARLICLPAWELNLICTPKNETT